MDDNIKLHNSLGGETPSSTTDLPHPDTKRWVTRRKAVLVNAVRTGVISLEEVCRRNELSVEDKRRSPCRAISERTYVVLVDILVRVVLEQHRGDDADDTAAEDIESDRVARLIGGEQCRRDERGGSAGDDRSELVTEPGAAIAQPRGERLRDQRRLWAIQCHDRNQRQRDREEDQNWRSCLEQREIDKTVQSAKTGADHVHTPTADAIGQMPRDRDPKKPQRSADDQRGQQEIARGPQHHRAEGEDVGRINKARRLLPHPG